MGSMRSGRRWPSIPDDLVEVGDDLVAVVRDDEGAGVAAFGEEDVKEIGERFLVVGELADGGVGVEPDEFAFLVVVLTAAPVGPGGVAAGWMLAAMAVSSVERQSRPGLMSRLAAERRGVTILLRDLKPERAARTCRGIGSCLRRPRGASPPASWGSRPERG